MPDSRGNWKKSYLIKDIFKKWEEGFEKKEGQEDIKYDEVRASADIEYTLKQSNPIQFIDRFLYNYYDTNKTELNKRAPILIKLFEEGGNLEGENFHKS